MYRLYFFTEILFILAIFRDLMLSARILHKSAYRFDLLFPTIKSFRHTSQQQILNVLRVLGLLLYFPSVLSDQLLDYYQYFVFIIFLIDIILFVRDFINKKIDLSYLTFRELLLGVLTIITIWILLNNAIIDRFFWLLLLERFSLIIYFFFALAFSFPFEIFEDIMIENAKKLIKSKKNLLFITVAGDREGLVSEYIVRILRQRIPVLRTAESISENIQLAYFINKTHIKDNQISVMDLRIHNTGDFRKIGELLLPQIGVIPVDKLYYGIKDSKKNKSAELFEIIRQDGLAIWFISKFTSLKSTKLIIEYLKQKKVLSLPIFIDKPAPDFKDLHLSEVIYCSDFNIEPESIAFQITIRKKLYTIQAPLLGEEQILGLIPAIIVARYNGFTMKELVHYISKLLPLSGRMNPSKTRSGAMIIDNSSASTVSSLYSVIRYLNLYSGKKILILPSLFDIQDITHLNKQKIILDILLTCDYCILLEKESAGMLDKVKAKGKSDCVVLYMNVNAIGIFLDNTLKNQNDVGVFMGPGTDILRKSYN